MAWLIGAAPAGAAPSDDGRPPAPQASFTLRVISPSPLYLAGRCTLEAGAVDAEGRPVESVAWMALSVDGRSPITDAQPPFSWDLDLAPAAARHQIELTAVGRDGSRAMLRAVSVMQSFVESVGVNIVLVPVVVRDASGALRTGLRQSDFQIQEDGAPQPIASFDTEPAPSWVLLALDTSASMERHLWSAQRALTDFMAPLPPGTNVGLLSFNDQPFLERDFTQDRKSIGNAVAALRTEGTRTALYDTVRIGSAHLAKRAGTRVLVLFTDGEDTVYEAEPGRLRTTIDAAQSADVAVYALAYGTGVSTDHGAPLAQLSGETGGEVAPARGPGQLKAAFGLIAASLGSRYLLSYEAPEPSRPGYRTIQVRVSLSGASVRARRGYVVKRR